MAESFSVAILGQGTVGSEVVNALHQDHPDLDDKAGKPIKLVAIHRRVPRSAGDFYQQNPCLYRNIADIVSDGGIDCVCELMGGIDAARNAIQDAMRSGKHVVSANKALFASHWPELVALAEQNNVQLRFEAAVAGGVPVLNAIATGSASENICQIRGIINGTTNFILTEMERNGTDYQEALAKAKHLGYAEADESADVRGDDACQKLSLLIAHAFGKHIPPDDIPTMGIDRVSLKDIEQASSMGCRIKLVARAEQIDGHVIARVGPELVIADSPLGLVPRNLNAVEVKSNLNTTGNFYQGEGAGGKPTAASVLTDIVNIARQSDRGYVPPFGRSVQTAENCPDAHNHAFYVRFVIRDAVGIIHDMTGVLKKHNISLNSIVQLPYPEGERAHLPFFITVEDTTEENLRRALDEIGDLPFNMEKPHYMRFERDDMWIRHDADTANA